MKAPTEACAGRRDSVRFLELFLAWAVSCFQSYFSPAAAKETRIPVHDYVLAIEILDPENKAPRVRVYRGELHYRLLNLIMIAIKE